MRGGFLDVAQRDPGIQGGRDKRVPERVGRDGLGDPGAAGGLADDPPGAVPVQPPTVHGQEHRRPPDAITIDFPFTWFTGYKTLEQDPT
jgi:hypothetical protein